MPPMSGGFRNSVFAPSIKILSGGFSRLERLVDRQVVTHRALRELDLAAPTADWKDTILDERAPQRNVSLTGPRLVEPLSSEIADLDPDERAEVHLSAEGHPSIEKRIQTSSLEPGSGCVVRFDQTIADLRSHVESDPSRPAASRQLLNLPAYSLGVHTRIARDEGGDHRG